MGQIVRNKQVTFFECKTAYGHPGFEWERISENETKERKVYKVRVVGGT